MYKVIRPANNKRILPDTSVNGNPLLQPPGAHTTGRRPEGFNDYDMRMALSTQNTV